MRNPIAVAFLRDVLPGAGIGCVTRPKPRNGVAR